MPALAVGGRFGLEACEHLVQSLGIRRVVDVRLEACDDEAVLRRHGIELLHLPTADHHAVDLQKLQDGIRWVNAALDDGQRVYVHCEHGVGRSALVALCVMVSRGHAPLEALRTAKAARWQVSPSPEQLDAFIDWCMRRPERPWPIPRFDELARIAYSHLKNDTAAEG